jgi:hypothetical protein
MQSMTGAAMGYAMMCDGWGRPSSLMILGQWFTAAVPIVAVTRKPSTLFSQCNLNIELPHSVALACQSFYAWRIYQFGGWIAMPIIIIFVRICTACRLYFAKDPHSIQFSLAQFASGYSLGIQVQLLTFPPWYMFGRLISDAVVEDNGHFSAARTRHICTHNRKLSLQS